MASPRGVYVSAVALLDLADLVHENRDPGVDAGVGPLRDCPATECTSPSRSTRAVSKIARTWSGVSRSNCVDRKLRPASLIQGFSPASAPAEPDTLMLPRHSDGPPRDACDGASKTSLLAQDLRWIFAEVRPGELTRPAERGAHVLQGDHGVTRTGSDRRMLEKNGNTGAVMPLAGQLPEVASLKVQIATTHQTLLRALPVAMLDEHGKQRECVEVDPLTDAQRPRRKAVDRLLELAERPALIRVLRRGDHCAHIVRLVPLRRSDGSGADPRRSTDRPGSPGSRR